GGTMGEVEPDHVDAGAQYVLQHARGVGGRAQGGDDLGAAEGVLAHACGTEGSGPHAITAAAARRRQGGVGGGRGRAGGPRRPGRNGRQSPKRSATIGLVRSTCTTKPSATCSSTCIRSAPSGDSQRSPGWNMLPAVSA